MDLRILKLVHEQVIQSISDKDTIIILEKYLRLVELTGNLQSESDKVVEPLAQLIKNLNQNQKYILKLSENIYNVENLKIEEWIYLYHLVSFVNLLKRNWDDFYEIIFGAYPDLGKKVQNLLSCIDSLSFSQGLNVLEMNWAQIDRDRLFLIVSLAYVRACALADLFGSTILYEHIHELLAFDRPFFVVFLAAACFKIPQVASRVDIAEWSDSHYACMSLLDNFGHLGDTSWG